MYFVQADDGPIKIGYCQSIGRLRPRVNSMQTGNHHELYVLGVIHGAGRLHEEEFHKRFSRDRVRGEWFRPTGPLLRLIYEEAEKVPGFPQRERSRRERTHEKRQERLSSINRHKVRRKARQRSDTEG